MLIFMESDIKICLSFDIDELIFKSVYKMPNPANYKNRHLEITKCLYID